MKQLPIKKILIVDDSEFDRQIIIRALDRDSNYHFEFKELEDGDDLERVAQEWKPDLVILDYSLPVMNGLDRLKQIFSHHGKIPFLFVMATGAGNESTAVEAMKLGALDYVLKESFSSDFIRKFLVRALEKSELQKIFASQQVLLEESERNLRVYVDELQSERELRERFVNTLTHDLRTPLAAAKMTAEFLRKKTVENESHFKLINRIEINLNRADHMLSNLLDANRLKAGQQLPIDVEAYQMKELISSALAELNAFHGDRFVLSTTTEVDGYWCKNGIRRVLENLGNNAIKYGDTERPVLVSLGIQDGKVLIEVHNEGTPIATQDQATLFDAFKRTEGAHAGNQKGWGLGLALVKGLVEAHGGTVGLLSNKKQGTTFWARLPIDCRMVTGIVQPSSL